jgi:hypothetical protein
MSSGAYQTLRDQDRQLLEHAFNAEAETMSVGRCARLLDCLLCRRGSGTALLAMDFLYLLSTGWMFFDMGIAFSRRNMLSEHWWALVLFTVPTLVQLVFFLLRCRYVFASAAERATVGWQLRHVARPLIHSTVDSLPVSAYLFMVPLFGGTLIGEQALPTELVARFFAAWRVAATRPSVLAVTVLYLVTSFCNWRTSSKHKWRVRMFVHSLQAQLTQSTQSMDSTLRHFDRQQQRPTTLASTAAGLSASRYATARPEDDNEGIAMTEIRLTDSPYGSLRPRRQAPTLNMTHVKYDDSDGEYSPRSGRRRSSRHTSPRDKKSKKKKSNGKSKSSGNSRRAALLNERPPDGTSIDVSIHSDNEEPW